MRVPGAERVRGDLAAEDTPRVWLAMLQFDAPDMGKFDRGPHAV